VGEATGTIDRFGWLISGLIAGIAMCVLAFTPLAWELSGREHESYPELIYFGVGLPSALISIISGALLVWFTPGANSHHWPHRTLKVTNVTSVAVCGLLALMVVPVLPFGTRVFEILFYVVLFMGAALAAAGLSVCLQARRA
jgi:hypothetical protein